MDMRYSVEQFVMGVMGQLGPLAKHVLTFLEEDHLKHCHDVATLQGSLGDFCTGQSWWPSDVQPARRNTYLPADDRIAVLTCIGNVFKDSEVLAGEQRRQLAESEAEHRLRLADASAPAAGVSEPAAVTASRPRSASGAGASEPVAVTASRPGTSVGEQLGAADGPMATGAANSMSRIEDNLSQLADAMVMILRRQDQMEKHQNQEAWTVGLREAAAPWGAEGFQIAAQAVFLLQNVQKEGWEDQRRAFLDRIEPLMKEKVKKPKRGDKNKEKEKEKEGNGDKGYRRPDLSNVTCWACNEKGHLATYCPKRRADRNAGHHLTEDKMAAAFTKAIETAMERSAGKKE